jgi:hypothetical protein
MWLFASLYALYLIIYFHLKFTKMASVRDFKKNVLQEFNLFLDATTAISYSNKKSSEKNVEQLIEAAREAAKTAMSSLKGLSKSEVPAKIYLKESYDSFQLAYDDLFEKLLS